ncbi:unnamed protein product [Owenia fusiformis]|uniref:protein disulfide-isomerase n=1 Tax=Owenia fusiformis TaxID=6347 RepID=A0A8S4MZ04_OWEFU|nr:unnamed protein product [Owenia fusiformis]
MQFGFSICVLLCTTLAFATALYSPSDDVIELTASNFDMMLPFALLFQLWFVEFYAPWCGHCKTLAPEWKKAAKALKGIVNVGAVDMTQHQSVGGPYNVKGFPTIKIFGSNKKSPQDYNGQRQASSIVDQAMSGLRSLVNDRLSGKSSGGSSGGSGGGSRSTGSGDPKDVIELTDSNFEKLVLNSKDIWLVEFFAPWCGHCKNLAPEWQKAATELKGKVKLGALDATVHQQTAGRYGVQGYPTIKMFQGGEASEYDGGRTASDIVSWGLNKAAENVPPPEIVQITKESDLTDACEDHQLCIISILPNILDCQSKCRNDYINILKSMGDKYKKKMWGYVWAEGGAQMDLEQALGIGGFGYPAMAAVNSRKLKYSLLRGSFSETGINEFLRELAFGKGSTAPVAGAKLPSIVATDPWDGKDGQLPEEEEYDLSDVELEPLDEEAKDEL